MKTTRIYFISLFLVSLLFLGASCEDKIIEKRTYTANVPVYMPYSELRAAVKTTATQPLMFPGKLFFHNYHLFINEIGKGIHVIDNSNPAAPEKITFIEIPGNVDLSIKGNALYADSYTDLVVLDISDLSNIKEQYRIEDAFEYRVPDYNYDYPLASIDENQGVIVDWEVKEITEEYEIEDTYYPVYFDGFAEFSNSSGGTGFGGMQQPTVSIAGSMARFIAHDNFLYTVNSTQLDVFDINNVFMPVQGQQLGLAREAETLFTYENHLFIGTTTGVMIYSLDNGSLPAFVSELSHVVSCDPVVVRNGIAYATLRSGNTCGGTVDRLDIIDVENLSSPELITSYEMTEPYGLGIDNNTLFVCDGDAGLKIFDASDCSNLQIITAFTDVNAYDVIPFNQVLMLIGSDGFYQYNYSDLSNIELLSVIPVEN